MKKLKTLSTPWNSSDIYFIRPRKPGVDNAHITSIRQSKPPTTKSEPHSFLGLCNVYQTFIPHFKVTAHRLNKLIFNGSLDKFKLNDNQLKSFSTLIDKVYLSTMLSLLKSNIPYSVDTDASSYVIGCNFFQAHDDEKRKPIGYWFSKLNPAERNYSAPYREFVSVVCALQTLRPYFLY